MGCQQKFTERRLMSVDPKEPERGIFTDSFQIPSSCACSSRAEFNSTASDDITTSTTRPSASFFDRGQPLRRSDRPSEKMSSFPSRVRDDISRPKFKIHEEFNKDWLMNFDSGRMQTTKRTSTTTKTTTKPTITTVPTTTSAETMPFLLSREDNVDDIYYYDYSYQYYETEKSEPLETTTLSSTTTTTT